MKKCLMLSTNLCNTFLAVWMHCASLEQIHLLDLYAGNFKAVYANAGSFGFDALN